MKIYWYFISKIGAEGVSLSSGKFFRAETISQTEVVYRSEANAYLLGPTAKYTSYAVDTSSIVEVAPPNDICTGRPRTPAEVLNLGRYELSSFPYTEYSEEREELPPPPATVALDGAKSSAPYPAGTYSILGTNLTVREQGMVFDSWNNFLFHAFEGDDLEALYRGFLEEGE